MAENKQNYCFLLGLNPLKESTYTEEAILKKIEAKRAKWANDSRNKQNDTEQRFKSERLVGLTDDMIRVMTTPALRKMEFKNGETLLKGLSQKLKMDCVILTDGTYVALAGTADQFVKKLHWDGVTKADVLKLADIKDGQPPKPVSEKITNAFKALRAVDTYTPVEMLNALITHPNLEIDANPLTEGSSLSQLRAAFEVCDKRVNSVRPDVLPEQDSYIQSMRSLKLVLNSDADMKLLTAYGKCNAALVPVQNTIEREYTSQLSRKYIDELLRAHLPRDVDSNMAIQILQQFCFKKKIAANFSNVDSSMTRCPDCGTLVQTGPNTMFCPACGKSFKTVCAACGTSQQSKNTVCIKCGFNFKEGMDKANRLALEFRMNIQAGKIAKAQKTIALLKETFPGYTGLAGMESEIQRKQDDIASGKKFILDAYDRGKHTEVKGATETLAEKYPDVMEDIELKRKYSDSCNRYRTAEAYCAKAAATDSRSTKMEMYVSAVEICPDHPIAREKLREDPPSGPLEAMGTLGERGFTIKFLAPQDANGLTYCIFREKNSLPNVNEDTRPLAEIPTTVYTDKTMEPGVEYYYSIHAKRWGILSKDAAHIGPVMTIAEVDNVIINHIDGGLRIMYEKPRGASRVRLWRSDGKENAAGTEIALNGETVYDDIGLVGGKKYYYLFVAEYEGRNKVERSQGVVFSETTVDAPKPVRDMKISWNKSDGTYRAKWSTNEHVVLYTASKKLTTPGNMVLMDDIKSWMTEIKPIMEFSDGVKFSLPDGAVQYVYPIIPLGKMGIKGTEMLVANLKPFRDVEYRISNKECVITMAWPADAVEAKLSISDGPAKGLEDKNAEIKTIHRDEYNEDKQIRIPMGKSRKKTINIFAVYKILGEVCHSRGITIEVNSGESRIIRYTMKKDKGTIMLDLTTSPGVYELPPMMLVQTAVGIPLKRTDGEVIWRSNGPVAAQNGKVLIETACPKITDIKNCRLFLENDSDYYDFRFVHPLFGRD